MRTVLAACACAACLCVSAAPAAAQLGLGYATYLGGPSSDYCLGVSLDKDGNAYILGHTNSYSWLPGSLAYPSDYPADNPRSGKVIFVSKYDPAGRRVWTTFFGSDDRDQPQAIAASRDGAYVTGTSWNHGGGFPVKSDIYHGDGERRTSVFVTKLDSENGSLEYSTFILPVREYAPNTVGLDIAVDSGGFAYVVGETTLYPEPPIPDDPYFPVTKAFQADYKGGFGDAFAVKLGPAGNTIEWATYLGGTGYDKASGIAVDADGNAFVTGVTRSEDFPVTAGAYMGHLTGAGTYDAFVTKLATGAGGYPHIAYSTYLPSGAGSPYDTFNERGTGIAVDAQGHAYAACTYGSLDSNAYDPSNIFVAKLAQDGSGLNYLKCVRGSATDESGRIAVDAAGCAYVAGSTSSADFDAYAGLDTPASGAGRGANPQEMPYPDAFVTKISSGGGCLEYSTQIGTGDNEWGGGIAVTSGGEAIVAGRTSSAVFPVTIGADQDEFGGVVDGFLADIFFVGSPGYCVRSSSLRIGDRFSVEARVNQDVEGPLDAFAIVSTNPTGGERMLGSFMLGGEMREGIFALARNLPGIQAPLSAVIMPEITIRENLVGSHTFYVVTTNPGLVPAGGMQMSPDEFDDLMQNKSADLKKDIVKTLNFHKWAVDPPELTTYRLPTAEEWNELAP